MLYIVSTPIGNLSDITYRAIEILSKCDYILCEDTRHSLPLLLHYGIKKPLKSYHKFNEVSQLDAIIHDLESGCTIALISDAGTPCISDPGNQIADACIQKGLPVQSIPGACALICALTSSGLNTETFQFVGFLPKKANELRERLGQMLAYRGTSICYESPFRLVDTLKTLSGLEAGRQLVVARELTKKFEEIKRGSAAEQAAYWSQSNYLKGEIVLLVSGDRGTSDWKELTPEEHVKQLQELYNLSLKEAIKTAAELRGVSKRTIYSLFHKN